MQRGVKPDLIVSSSALRARTTAQSLAAELDLAPDRLVQDKRLYSTSATNLLYVIQELDDKLGCVMLVGHNPEMTELARHFSKDIPDMPTCAVAQFDFEADSWLDVGAGVPVTTRFEYPKKPQA